MGRRLVVSDIHGELERFRRALQLACYRPDSDRLFLLGDYIDRGSDSEGVLKMVRSMVRDGAVALKGNHEDMMIRAASDPAWLRSWFYNGGEVAFGGQMAPEWAVEFASSLPLYHEEPDWILVHAGLRPHVSLEQQDERDLLWIRDEFILGYLGKDVVFGHTPVSNIHRVLPSELIVSNTNGVHDQWSIWRGVSKLGIDTGSVFGGYVTVVDLDTYACWRA